MPLRVSVVTDQGGEGAPVEIDGREAAAERCGAPVVTWLPRTAGKYVCGDFLFRYRR